MLGSMQDIIVIAVVALIVVGPKKLPEMARTLGRAFTEFKKATEGITDELKDALKEETKPEYTPPEYTGMGMPVYVQKEEPKPEQPEAPEYASHEEPKPEQNDAPPPIITAPEEAEPAGITPEDVKPEEVKSEETKPESIH